MTCSPNDFKVDVPQGNAGVSIPGFGVPFAIKGPDIAQVPLPSGFPEDLVGILNNLQFLKQQDPNQDGKVSNQTAKPILERRHLKILKKSIDACERNQREQREDPAKHLES